LRLLKRVLLEEYVYGLISGLGITLLTCALWIRSIVEEVSYRLTYGISGWEAWINGILSLTIMLAFLGFFATLIGILLGFSHIAARKNDEESSK